LLAVLFNEEVLFNEDLVRLDISSAGWEEAVRAVGCLLVDAGAVESRYVDGMVRMVREIGSYIAMAPGVAIPHARPEEGAKRIAVAVARLEKPVVFPGKDDNPVDLIIAFSGVDNTSHLGLIKGLAGLLRDEVGLRQVRSVKDTAELVRLLRPVFTGMETPKRNRCRQGPKLGGKGGVNQTNGRP